VGVLARCVIWTLGANRRRRLVRAVECRALMEINMRLLFAPIMALLLFAIQTASGGPIKMTFDPANTSHIYALNNLDRALPADWSQANFLVLEIRATSSERFELGLQTRAGLISKRIHPFPNVWLRASIPLAFYRNAPGNGADLAATMNQPRGSYWINIERGGHGPIDAVSAVSFAMPDPIGTPTLEIRSIKLSATDPGDAILEGKPLIDQFGQYIHADWPDKATTLDDLKKAWDAESQSLAGAHYPMRSQYGGFLAATAPPGEANQIEGATPSATGYFRVQEIDGKWWFVDPEGHLFFSTGANAMGTFGGVRTAGRTDLFAALPPVLNAATAPTASVAGAPGRGFGGANFYAWNLQRRFGADWQSAWAKLTLERMESWGLTTLSGPDANLAAAQPRKPYVRMLRWQLGQTIMGMPDVYAADFVQRVKDQAAAQCGPNSGDPWLIGYFIGNEPPWPGRESQLVDMILANPAAGPMQTNSMQAKLRDYLKEGDTLARRRAFIIAAFQRYLAVITTSIKASDPNHLDLGIRFGGSPPDDVIACASVFDVYSHNIYSYAPATARLDKFYRLTGRPILIGEFHIGAPDRGMAPGLVQVANQSARGVAYQYYLEHAAAHPAVIGAHWFEWMDEPSLGRNDGENYNIGMIDVTDRPYEPLVEAMKRTHARLLDVHLGKVAPSAQLPEGHGRVD
jgi:hypothetical protein